MHNFTVSAQDIFTFGRLSVFTVSFTGILQVLVQIMKRFTLYYWLVKWFWYRVYNQKVLSSSQHKFSFFTFLFDSFNFIIIDVPRPLSNVLWIIIFKRLMTHTVSQSVWNIYVLQNRIVYVIKRLKPLFLDQYFQICEYSHASKLLAFVIFIFVGSSPRMFTVSSICEVESLCFWHIF